MMKDIPWRSCLRVGLTAVAAYLACVYWHGLASVLARAAQASGPLWQGAGMAWLLSVPVRGMEALLPSGLTWRRAASLALSLVLAALGCLWLVRTLLPEVLRCAELLLSALPGALEALLQWLETNGRLNGVLSALGADVQSLADGLLRTLSGSVGRLMGTAAELLTAWTAAVSSLGISLMFAVYLIMDRERLGRQGLILLRRMAGERIAARTLTVLRTLDECFRQYVRSACLEALWLGGLCFVGMALCGFSHALTVSVLVGLSALVPVAGPLLAGCGGAFLLLTASPAQTLLFLIFFVLLQQLESGVIYPRVVGAGLGLSGVWVLAAVTLGGGLMGIPGVLLSVPVCAALQRLLHPGDDPPDPSTD